MERTRRTRSNGVLACSYGAALRFYEVSLRYAPTPQAKGKIERAHDFWQKRLPPIFAAKHIATLPPANALLEKLRLHHNARELHACEHREVERDCALDCGGLDVCRCRWKHHCGCGR